MKANLPQNEPKMLARWEETRIYERIRQARKGSPTYILHDGPPYTSGPIHLGTALNKCLKDFIVKSKNMAGYDAPYVPRMGLPRPSDRDQGRQRTRRQEAADASHGRARGMPQVRPEVSRLTAAAVQTNRRLRPLRPPLRHDEPAVRVGCAFDVFFLLRKWLRLQGPARRLLVHARRDRARRSRGRVREPHQSHRLGEVRVARRPRED